MDFHSSVETIGWFRNRYLEGSLKLKPSYQRNAVWMARQKSYLVESVLKDMPIPEVFVQLTTDEMGETTYAVVDGQQRVRAILQFIGAEGDPDQVEFDSFSLDKLETGSPWYGKQFSDLSTEQKIKFFGYKLSIRYLESDNEDQIKDMFRRLNKFTAPLKPAELRNATYGGPFAQLAVKMADEHSDILAENRIITADAIRRMTDVEFFAELIIATLNGPQGGSAGAIDSYYQTYEDYEGEFPRQARVRRDLTRALLTVEDLVPDLRHTRWSNKNDFYSLVVAVVDGIRKGALTDERLSSVRENLQSFAADVERRLEEDEATVPETAAAYARAVRGGANDKSRRVARHEALLKVFATSAPANIQS